MIAPSILFKIRWHTSCRGLNYLHGPQDICLRNVTTTTTTKSTHFFHGSQFYTENSFSFVNNSLSLERKKIILSRSLSRKKIGSNLLTFCLQPGCRRSSMQKNVVLCRRTWLCTRLDAEESELKRIERLGKRPQARKESIFPLRRAIRHVEKLQRIFLYLTCSRFVLLLLLLMDNVKIPYTNICIKQNNSAIYIITQWQISDFFS